MATVVRNPPTTDKTVQQVTERLKRSFAVRGASGRLEVRVVSEKMTGRYRAEPVTAPLTDQVTPVFNAVAKTPLGLLREIRRRAREKQIYTIHGLGELERLEELKRGSK